MGENIIERIIGIFGGQTGGIIGVIFIAMLPVIELRGAIPVAYLGLGFSWQSAVFFSVIGNMIPIPFILFFLETMFNFMKKHNILTGLVNKMESIATEKNERISKIKFWGLVVFVAIPLPGTGAWTGSLIASVMKMDKKSAFLSVLAGVLIAAVIVTLMTLAADGVIGIFNSTAN